MCDSHWMMSVFWNWEIMLLFRCPIHTLARTIFRDSKRQLAWSRTSVDIIYNKLHVSDSIIFVILFTTNCMS